MRSKAANEVTLLEFQDILASLPETIAVSKYVADKTQFPRVVWNEVGISPEYASNGMHDLEVTVAVELITLITDTSALWVLAYLFAGEKLMFDAVCGYDQQNEWFTCEFNLTLLADPVDVDG